MTEILEEMSTRVDQEQLAQDLVEQARTQGLELMGPVGLLTGRTKRVLDTALEAEISEHLGHDRRNRATSRTAVGPSRC